MKSRIKALKRNLINVCAVLFCPGQAEVPDSSDPLGQLDGHDSPVPTLKGKPWSVLWMQAFECVFRVPCRVTRCATVLKAWPAEMDGQGPPWPGAAPWVGVKLNSTSVLQHWSYLRDRVWGEVDKNNFIALPGKGGHSRLMSSTTCPNLEWEVRSSIGISGSGNFMVQEGVISLLTFFWLICGDASRS